jgi:hypothetical protein
MKSVRLGAWAAPIALLIVTMLSYGLLLPLTGFYWDDWPFAWIARFLGPAEFIPAFQGFRPFLGPIFFVTTSLIPPDPLLWQILALFIRWFAALSAWFALRQVWPNHRRETLIASLLFLVFPGYSQHWVSFTHINQEWIPLIFYLLSFGFSTRALRSPAAYLVNTIAALLFLVVGAFPTEYFIGLEPLRFLFIWIIAAEASPSFESRLVRTLKAWWPYLVVWLVNIVWLVHYYRSGAYISYDLTVAKTAAVPSQILLVLADALWKAGVYVWVQVLALLAKSITTPTSLMTVGVIILAFILISFYLRRADPEIPSGPLTSGLRAAPNTRNKLSETGSSGFAVPAIVVGTAGLLLGRLPSFAAGLPLTLQSSFDRFMISMMLGASLLLAGLASLLLRNQRLRTYACVGLIALGVGQQFFNANIFRRDWQRQEQIYWQFAWRIPALQPGTAIITQQMPLDYETDLSMTAALNWIYAPQVHPAVLPYALIYSEKRLGGAVLPDLNAGTPIYLPFRTVDFSGTTSQAIVIYVPPVGCLRVLDPAYDDQATYSRFPESLSAPIPLSNPGLIKIDAPALILPNPPFGGEPSHTWCYFYERAELARQERDWSSIMRLSADASKKGFGPQDPFEWLPFIEADARAGNMPAAEQISLKAWNDDPRLHRGLCALWQRLQSDGPDDAQGVSVRLIGEFGCGR